MRGLKIHSLSTRIKIQENPILVRLSDNRINLVLGRTLLSNFIPELREKNTTGTKAVILLQVGSCFKKLYIIFSG